MTRQRKVVGGSGAAASSGGGGASGIDPKPHHHHRSGGSGASTNSSSISTTSSTATNASNSAPHTASKSKNGGGLAAGKGGSKHAAGGGGGGGGGAGGGAVGLRRFVVLTRWHILIGTISLAVASYFGYLGYLETRVNTPFDDQRIVQTTAGPSSAGEPGQTTPGDRGADRFWGTYRPGTYFGLKTRDPHSLVMGLMWFRPTRLQPDGNGLRHWCESGDGLKWYGWNQHDGRTFGVQSIEEEDGLRLETSFVKFPAGAFGGDWTARISVTGRRNDELVSLIWYTALDERTGGQIMTDSQTPLTGVRGHTPGLGDFRLHIHQVGEEYTGEAPATAAANRSGILHESYLSTRTPNLQVLHQLTLANFRLVDGAGGGGGRKPLIALPGDVLTDANGERLAANYIATMVTGRLPFAIDIAYKSTSGLSPDAARLGPPVGAAYAAALAEWRATFATRFERTFGLRAKGYADRDVHFAESALSNMIGGIGYFYGASRVQSQHTPEPVPYWRAPLYTAVPSRSFFPRGFLWDEGFHGLLIAAWDPDIELDIMAHWFDLMNREGWIPREQILGAEALAKVPEEFVTQRNTAANPPTFFLTLKRLLARGKELQARHLETLERMYPRLQAWFAWFNNTQRGEAAGTYRWRGREPYDAGELNPKTLTSGLDDYPRASHPTAAERHVDLRCWLAMAAGVMADLARLLERDDFRYLETHFYLADNQLLNEQHLSPYTQTYSDWGLHTDAVSLKRSQQIAQPHGGGGGGAGANHQAFLSPRKVRVTAKQPELRFVDRTFGYVSLFPFLLELLDADAPALGRTLDGMRDEAQLWTAFGLRSLSRASPLYMKRNTEHDPPYWRGQIWMNINYLAVKALHHYGWEVSGPFAQRAQAIYGELRANLVRNVAEQYERTGFVWEQYNDATGVGSGCKPFTGWSALTVLMMAEQY